MKSEISRAFGIAALLSCIPAIVPAQSAPVRSGPEPSVLSFYGQALLIGMARDRCVRDVPAQAARYADAAAAWVAPRQPELAASMRYFELFRARATDQAAGVENAMYGTYVELVTAPGGKALDAQALRERCDHFFTTVASDKVGSESDVWHRGLHAQACAGAASAVAPPEFCVESATLAAARRQFRTAAAGKASGEPLPRPPAGVFDLVRYPSSVGALPAWRTSPAGDGKRHPAIVWITGGDTNTIDDVWRPAPRDNDQTAAAYRQAGIVTMFPSLRGGNTNPGRHEGFYGEVDDVLAAADWLAAQPDVDPARIYLGGHSTGGTLALLTAETSARFRAVFAFGPVANGMTYGKDLVPLDAVRADPREITLRSPALWLSQVASDTFVIEGERQPANYGDLVFMSAMSANPKLHFVGVTGATHFSVLAPVNALIARRILADGAASSGVRLAKPELDAAIAAPR